MDKVLLISFINFSTLQYCDKQMEPTMQDNQQFNNGNKEANQNLQQKQQPNEKIEQKENPNDEQSRICQFYVARKRRYCKFQAIKGSKFCSVHCSDQQNKIECPYQKGMFIDAAKFEKHLQICPMIKNKNKQEANQWFNKGVNLNQQQSVVQAANINTVMDIEEEKLITVIRRIVKFFRQSFGEKSIEYIKSTEKEKIENLTNDHTQAHLLAEGAYKVGLIRDDIIYLQFGAGKGILSYHLAEKVKKKCNKMSKNVLLERQSRRNKFDRFIKDNPYFQRYKSDVSDFDVQKLPQTMAQTAALRKPGLDEKKQAAELSQLQIVGVCKHMCGGALDISLRALLKTKMSGCILASCCHHLCSYDSYLNNKFFEQREFSPDQIQIIFRISAWGTKSCIVDQNEINLQELSAIEQSNLNSKNKVIVGRICKRLIDLGRSQILNCQLLRYCSDQITPQNYVIISK